MYRRHEHQRYTFDRDDRSHEPLHHRASRRCQELASPLAFAVFAAAASAVADVADVVLDL